MSQMRDEGILDYYAVLAVSRSADAAAIRKAYRAKALRWHPDKAGDLPENRRRFQETTDAYTVLADDGTRKRYDSQLAASDARAAARQASSSVPKPAATPKPAPKPGPSPSEQTHQRTSDTTRPKPQTGQPSQEAKKQAGSGGFSWHPPGYAAGYGSPPPRQASHASGYQPGQQPQQPHRNQASAANEQGSQRFDESRRYQNFAKEQGSQRFDESGRHQNTAREQQSQRLDEPTRHPGATKEQQSQRFDESARSRHSQRRPMHTGSYPEAHLPMDHAQYSAGGAGAPGVSTNAPAYRTGDSSRLTAAEVHPHGFDGSHAFRASLSDLKTFATFQHDGTIWVPQVVDVDWCRPPENPRCVQLKFVAEYAASRSKGAGANPILTLLQTSSCDALMTSLQQHIDIIAPSSVINTSLRIQPSNPIAGVPEVQFRLKIRLEGQDDKIMESFNKAWEVAPLGKMKDCPLM
eukprot:TRINITY_DN9785_c0_g1_i2.p1 TRINITY_DN9785_c0_g1~~TRINITY_DN9785_c0_g1_i2.p1  ORF type:complete len:464 (+),score=63.19 TRINITY_DN9785_c0_g1_i2:87-1478(+)